MAFISDEERKRILAQMLSGQLMRPPPPMQATPASPLPGVPVQTAIVAPQSEAAVAPPPVQDEFALARQLLAGQKAPAMTGNKEIDAILTANAAQRQQGAQGYLDMLAKADIAPVLQDILAERRARAEKERAELEEDQKKSGWDALMRAGLAMAQSNSPYFMQALASGMEAGVKGYDEAKIRRDEKRARLQTADEDARLAEIQGKQAAQSRAAAAYNAALAAGRSEQEADAAARKAAEDQATLPQRMELAKLEPEAKRADIAYTKARTVDALRPPSSGRGGSGGDGTGKPRELPPGQRAETEGRLATAYTEQDEAYRDWVRKGKPLIGKVKEGSSEWQAASKYEAARGKVNNLLGTLGRKTLGVAPTRPGGQRITQEQRGRAPAARPATAPARPAGVGADWTYEKDAKGNKAWVSPDRKRVVEVK